MVRRYSLPPLTSFFSLYRQLVVHEALGVSILPGGYLPGQGGDVLWFATP